MKESLFTFATIIRAIVVLMLLGALADNSYGYYQMLRFVVMVVAGYTAYLAYGQNKSWWAGGMVAIAILFNPILPFYFERETWIAIDLIVAVVFFISIFNIKQDQGNESSDAKVNEHDEKTTKIVAAPMKENIGLYAPNAKYCSQCGGKIVSDKNKFCVKCGNKLG